MQVLIPAGGQGTRLRPLTLRIPKPLLPLGTAPILTHILKGVPAGVTAVPIITPGLVGPFQSWQTTLNGRTRVELFVEEPDREAPGPVAGLLQCLRSRAVAEDVVIVMGDSVLPFSLDEFAPRDRDHASARLAAYRLPAGEDASRFGVLEVTSGGRLASFQEKPASPRSNLVFTGCLYLPARLVPQLLQCDPSRMPQMGDMVSELDRLGEPVDVFEVRGEWHDIGTFSSYLAAHRPLLDQARLEALRVEGCVVEGTVYVHPEARAIRSHLRDTVLWRGAEVSDSDLTQCIVEVGVQVRGTRANASHFGLPAGADTGRALSGSPNIPTPYGH